MRGLRSLPKRSTIAWSFAGFLALSIAFFSISVPEAVAQTQKTSSADSKSYSQLIQSIYQFIVQNYVDEVDPAKLYEGAMKGMFESLGDPHSVFLDEAMLSDMMQDTDGIYAGVGLYISKEPGVAKEGDPKYVEVVSPIEDTPAWKAGIRPGDLIISIGGESTADLTVDKASAKIKGAEGTKVTLTFRRGASYEFDVEFTRTKIEIPAIKQGVITRSGVSVGYIRIIEWIPQTAERMKEALAAMSKAGIKHLIVDVRSNPGGLLDSVVDVCDLFLDGGMIVSTKGRNPQENFEFKAKPDLSLDKSVKMIVLINKGSASASEIFSGAMKDTKRALLLGTTSYGKGSVQQVFPLDKTGFKLTMARYYTPSGVNIDKTGITPDIAVSDIELTEAQFGILEKLYDSGAIRKFAAQKPDAGKEERDAFADSLAVSGYALPQKFLRKLVRDELDKTKPAPIFDMEFDTQLNEALRILLDKGFDEMLQQSKTLGETVAASKKTSSQL
jgi:carboxyl-terminal processing protease